MRHTFLAIIVILLSLFTSKGTLANSPTPTRIPTSVLSEERSVLFPSCAGETLIQVPHSVLKYLNWSDICVTPTMIVIHFTGDWTDADDTIAVLNDRRLGCHLATYRNDLVQMLNMFEDKVERAGCAAGYNNFAVHNEISGTGFDKVIQDPDHPKYEELVSSTDTAMESTCWLMKTYDIPITQIFGHHEITVGKPDPGPVYMEYFRSRIKKECS